MEAILLSDGLLTPPSIDRKSEKHKKPKFPASASCANLPLLVSITKKSSSQLPASLAL